MIQQINFYFKSHSKYKFDNVELAYLKIKDLLKSLKIDLFGDLSAFSRKDSCDYYHIDIWINNNLLKDYNFYKALKLDIMSVILNYLSSPDDSTIRFFEK